MSDRKPPPPPPEEVENHGIFERIVKRGIETGVGAFTRSEDTLRGFVERLKLPSELASVAMDQIDETKKGLYGAVAKEIRDFLQSTNFASDVRKILTGLAFEVKMEVRFKNVDEDDQGTGAHVRPDVTAQVTLKDPGTRGGPKHRKSVPPPPPPPTPTPSHAPPSPSSRDDEDE